MYRAKEVYIIDAKRSAIGNYLGAISKINASDLSAAVIKEILKQNKLDPSAVDEVILGQVLTAGQGQNPARRASINSGLPYHIPSYTINKVCGSAMQSIASAFDSISLGNADIIIAGGQENMSLAPHASLMRQAPKMGDIKFQDLMIYDGLTDVFSNKHMGITAENIAKKYGITREQQDEFALNSQKKASKASKDGLFKNEIVPIDLQTKKEIIKFEDDEFIKHDTKIQNLAKLKPAFDSDSGTVTAGNSSGINDGAAILMLASAEAIEKYNLKPLVRISGHASAGVDPDYMGLGPVEAVKKLNKKLDWRVSDLDLIEANEAFASQAIAVNNLLELDASKVNISGGGIALGHPIGASGARVTVTLVHNMLRLKANKTIATLCIGGGMGIAMGFELAE